MGTLHKGTDKEIRALDAYIKLVRASNTIISRVGKTRAGHKLTVSQFGILEALYHLGPLNQRDLALKILKSGPNITTVIDNLERAGLVRRERNLEDRRSYTVSLTAGGQELIERAFPDHVQAIVEAMNKLSPEEQDELARLCRKLGLGQ